MLLKRGIGRLIGGGPEVGTRLRRREFCVLLEADVGSAALRWNLDLEGKHRIPAG